jgi:dipeptidyl aminopeptidase/acylaminoacyl peptidase
VTRNDACCGSACLAFLILQGEKDTTVPLSQSQSLHDALTKAGVESTLYVVKEGGHDFKGTSEPASVRGQDDARIFRKASQAGQTGEPG